MSSETTRWAVHFGRSFSRPKIMSEDAAIAYAHSKETDAHTRDLYANTWRNAEDGGTDDGPTWVVEASTETEAMELALNEFYAWCADAPEGGVA